jgi:hypothetical protein
MSLTVGSLFAGIGGFDLGFERAGFEIKWQVEIDPFCRRVLEKHWPNVTRYFDVRKVRNPERVDVICGGFPCSDVASSLLPTLTHQSYGSNRGGAAGRSGKWRPSLPTLLKSDTMSRGHHTGAGKPKRCLGTMAAHGKLPTLTVNGNYNRKGASATSGDGLATAIGGRLNPTWCEWFMGFPLGHTDAGCPIASPPSVTPLSRSKSSGSRNASKPPKDTSRGSPAAETRGR